MKFDDRENTKKVSKEVSEYTNIEEGQIHIGARAEMVLKSTNILGTTKMLNNFGRYSLSLMMARATSKRLARIFLFNNTKTSRFLR